MSNFKILTELPSYSLYNDLQNLLKNQIIKWSGDNQICINTTLDEPYNYFKGSGSLVYDWNNAEKIIDKFGNEKISVPKYTNPLKEEDFCLICEQFKNTSFEYMFTKLRQNFKIGRIRLMKSKPQTCLSWHRDDSPRIHYPLKTQDGCFMVIENEIKHLEQDKWWWTNTILKHTAFNSSKEDRIHLVAVLL